MLDLQNQTEDFSIVIRVVGEITFLGANVEIGEQTNGSAFRDGANLNSPGINWFGKRFFTATNRRLNGSGTKAEATRREGRSAGGFMDARTLAPQNETLIALSSQ